VIFKPPAKETGKSHFEKIKKREKKQLSKELGTGE
jgi:hypothetical protein